MSKYIDNDDDLFEYDPELETSKPINFDTPTAIPESKSDFINEMKNHFGSDIENLTGNISPNKHKLAASFNLAYKVFVNEILKEGTAKSISIVLDGLTNGDFSLMSMFYETEIKISKKIFFLDLVERAFIDPTSNENVIKQLDDILHIDFSDLYIQSCYQSTINICKHSLMLDQALYLCLSKKLGIAVKQYLFEPINESAGKDHQVYLEDYKKELSESIKKLLLDHGLLAEVQEISGTQVKLTTN